MSDQRYSYFGSFVHSPYETETGQFVLLRVISTAPSKPTVPKGVRWRPSYASLRRGLATIFRAPLLGPPEKGHDATEVVGRPVRWEVPDGFIDAVFEITNPTAWSHIVNNKWRAVSPQVTALAQHQEDHVIVLDDWTFEHVAFVPEGGFADAEVIDWFVGDPGAPVRLAGELHRERLKQMSLRELEQQIQLSQDMDEARRLRDLAEGQQLEQQVRDRLHGRKPPPALSWKQLNEYARQLRMSMPTVEQIQERLRAEQREQAVREKLRLYRRPRR